MAIADLLQEICRREGWATGDGGRAIEVPGEGGRRQTVFAETFQHEGRELLRVFTRIGPAARLSGDRPLSALRVNFSMAYGCLAVTGQDLVLVDTQLTASADYEEVRNAIAYIANNGDRYERLIYGTDRY